VNLLFLKLKSIKGLIISVMLCLLWKCFWFLANTCSVV